MMGVKNEKFGESLENMEVAQDMPKLPFYSW